MKRFLLVIVGAALFLSAACANLTQAEIQGILEKVDSVSGQVTVKLTDGSVVTVDLKDLNLETVKKTLGSPTLDPGSSVTLQRGPDEKVRKVVVKSAEAKGTIKSLDAAKKLVTVELKKGGTLEFKVTDATKIGISEDEEGTFADLQVGMNIEAKYNSETSEAVKIEQEEDEKVKGEDREGSPGEADGIIKSLDAAKKTVILELKKGGTVELKVTDVTKIELKEKGKGGFGDLQAGMKLEAKYDPATSEATKVEVKGEDRRGRSEEGKVEGIVTSVDATTASVVIKLGDGTQTTVKVQPSTLIKVEDKVSSLGQLQAGLKVKVKLNPATKEAVKIETKK